MKKLNVKCLLFIALTMCMSSCMKTYYQVSTTKPVNPGSITETNEQYVYEDANCRITYDMWKNEGNSMYVFTNKTDRNMYIDLSKSCGLTNREATNVKDHSTAPGVGTLRIVPPHTSREFSKFILTDSITMVVGLKEKVKHSESVSFTKENSPFTFGQYITYCFDNHEGETTIVHEFYVNRITNMPKKELIRKTKATKIENGKRVKYKTQVWTLSPKTGFYVRYHR